MRTSRNLLDQIEDGALDPSTDLPSVLRNCVALGGKAGSSSLRDWAALELKGYGPDDDAPEYRTVGAQLVFDVATVRGRATGYPVPLQMIPDFARDKLQEIPPLRQSIAEIAAMVRSANRAGDESLGLEVQGGPSLVAIMNHEHAEAQAQELDGLGLPPSQNVERIYWSVHVTSLERILDVVRTTLVELVAEMRAGTPQDRGVPPAEVADQAVAFVLRGIGHRVQMVNVAEHGSAGDIAADGISRRNAETPSWRMWAMVVGVATIVAAIAAVLALPDGTVSSAIGELWDWLPGGP